MTHRFHPSILREYDIRGVVGETLGPDDARVLGRCFAAVVRADGSLVAEGVEHGSIHGVGAKLQGAPSCNGWTFWHIEHEGEVKPIDALRQLYLLAVED